MTNKNKAIIALIVALVVTAIFCYWTNSNKVPYSQSENTVATSSSTKLYHNDEFGFQFEYPSDFYLREVGTETRRPTPQLFEVLINDGKPGKSQTLVFRVNVREGKLKDVSELKYNYQEWMPNEEVLILKTETINFAGEEALQERLFNQRSTDLPEIWTHILENDKVYTLIMLASTSTEKVKQDFQELENIINTSFKFTK
jgi:hypothetical protein